MDLTASFFFQREKEKRKNIPKFQGRSRIIGNTGEELAQLSKYWNPFVHELDPYVPGEQPKDKRYIKLNTNENPFPPSPLVLQAIQQTANGDLRLYPDPNADELRAKIAEVHQVKADQVFVGNGSDEILAFAFQAFFDPTRPILFPDITYSFYKVYAKMFRVPYQVVPLQDDFQLTIEPFSQDNGGIIFPNPNAPTGKALSADAIKELLTLHPDSIIIIDEAYVDFGGESMIPCVQEYPNLLVIQTLSKSRSLAGLRVGFAIGNEELIEGLQRIKNCFNSYTLDRLALAGAVASFSDEAYFEQTRKAIMDTRSRVTEALQEIGFGVVESSANFIFITHPQLPASSLFAKLKEAGVLVRYFNQPRIDNYLRVTIGLDEEMDQFLRIIRDICEHARKGESDDI